jgi:hypothetical protein
LTRAFSTVAIAAGLVLGGGAFSSAPAFASAHTGTEDGTVSIQAFEGPFYTWRDCNTDREWAERAGYDTTPCFRDPKGWYYQYF